MFCQLGYGMVSPLSFILSDFRKRVNADFRKRINVRRGSFELFRLRCVIFRSSYSRRYRGLSRAVISRQVSILACGPTENRAGNLRNHG